MKHKEQKENQNVVWKIITLFGTPYDVIQLVQLVRGTELPWPLFCFIMTVALVITAAFFWDCMRKFIKSLINMWAANRRLYNAATRNVALQMRYGYLKKRNHEKFFFRCKEIAGQTWEKKRYIILATPLLMFVVCICNPINARGYWKRVQEFSGVDITENVDVPVDNVKQESQGLGGMPEEKKDEIILRGECWRFILDTPEVRLHLEEDRKEQAFFGFTDISLEHSEDVLEVTRQWQEYPRNGVDYTDIEDEEGNTFYIYTQKEDAFKERAENASQYLTLEKWTDYAPHSAELDELIAGREKLNSVAAGDEKGCYKIWWLLANDYQYYAQEYEAQTDNKDTILYYYANSIYCCMQALKYSISVEQYQETYHYMVMRYHDIFRDDCKVDSEYKEKARMLYYILVKADALHTNPTPSLFTDTGESP